MGWRAAGVLPHPGSLFPCVFLQGIGHAPLVLAFEHAPIFFFTRLAAGTVLLKWRLFLCDLAGDGRCSVVRLLHCASVSSYTGAEEAEVEGGCSPSKTGTQLHPPFFPLSCSPKLTMGIFLSFLFSFLLVQLVPTLISHFFILLSSSNGQIDRQTDKRCFSVPDCAVFAALLELNWCVLPIACKCFFCSVPCSILLRPSSVTSFTQVAACLRCAVMLSAGILSHAVDRCLVQCLLDGLLYRFSLSFPFFPCPLVILGSLLLAPPHHPTPPPPPPSPQQTDTTHHPLQRAGGHRRPPTWESASGRRRG